MVRNENSGNITTSCPYCNNCYEWYAEQDDYRGTTTRNISLNKKLMVTLWFCACGAVLATMVTDDFGGQLYVPCTDEL